MTQDRFKVKGNADNIILMAMIAIIWNKVELILASFFALIVLGWIINILFFKGNYIDDTHA